MVMPFGIGDKVKIVNNGQIGKVVEVTTMLSGEPVYKVEFSGKGAGQDLEIHTHSELDLVLKLKKHAELKFPLGSHVVEKDSKEYGMIHEVSQFKDGSALYLVDFKDSGEEWKNEEALMSRADYKRSQAKKTVDIGAELYSLYDSLEKDHLQDVPFHYAGDVQPIELMQAQMSTEKFLGFLLGNIIKYASRFGKNGKAMSDAKKIRQYAEWLVQMTEHGEIEVEHYEK